MPRTKIICPCGYVFILSYIQILWPSDVKSPLIGKDPDDKTDGQRRRGRRRMRWVGGIHYSMDMSLSKPWETKKDREACPWLAGVHGVAKRWIQLSDWKTTTTFKCKPLYLFCLNYENITASYFIPSMCSLFSFLAIRRIMFNCPLLNYKLLDLRDYI